MALDIYSGGGYRQPFVQFRPTYQTQPLDLGEVKEYGDELVEIENNRVETIQDNYTNMLETKDTLTGIDYGSEYGRQVLERKKQEYGLGEDTFRMNMRDLEDPFKVRQVRSQLSSFMGDKDVKQVIRDAAIINDFESFIDKLDGEMAELAKKDLNQVLYDDTGKKNIRQLSKDDYTEVNISDLMLAELQQLPSDLSIETTREGGHIIFSESENFQMSGDEFADYVVDKYADNAKVRNTLRSKIGQNGVIGDPDAIQEYLSKEASKAYSVYDGRGTKNTIRRDYGYTSPGGGGNSSGVSSGSTGGGGSSSPITFSKQRTEYGLDADAAIAQMQVNQHGLDLSNPEVLKAVQDAAATMGKGGKRDGFIPQDKLNELVQKYGAASKVDAFTMAQISANSKLRNLPAKDQAVVATALSRGNEIVKGTNSTVQQLFFDNKAYPKYTASDKNRD